MTRYPAISESDWDDPDYQDSSCVAELIARVFAGKVGDDTASDPRAVAGPGVVASEPELEVLRMEHRTRLVNPNPALDGAQ